jgi:predicted O-methyltransferase YrrM
MLSKVVSRAATALARPVDRMADARWFSYPLGRAPRGTRADYEALAAQGREAVYPEVDAYERRTGFALDPAWLHELALHTQVAIKKAAPCYPHGRLLYSTVRAYVRECAPERVTVLETGTARGFSSLCMARALDDAGVPGTIVTCDVLPHDVPMFWNCIDDLDGPRSRAELLRPWADLVERYVVYQQGDTLRHLPRLYLPRVNVAFLDGQHTYAYVLREFEAIRGRQRPGDVIFFDDYTPARFPGVVQAVDEICAGHGYDRETLHASGERGYVVARKR